MKERLAGLLGRLPASTRPRQRGELWAAVYAAGVDNRPAGTRGSAPSRSNDD